MSNISKEIAEKYVESISQLAKKIEHVRLMEVCGTHTVSIFRAGIRQLLPKNIELVSGPGCPVCVTADDYIDKAIEYSKLDDFEFMYKISPDFKGEECTALIEFSTTPSPGSPKGASGSFILFSLT